MNKEDYFKYYIQGSDHYLIPKDVFKELFNEMINWKEENQELKEQLEENQNPLKGIFAQVNDDTLLRDCGNMNAEINELKNQQKEFIEYLEKMWKETQDIWYIKILQKYKEIIGGNDV